MFYIKPVEDAVLHRRVIKLMESIFEITVVSEDACWANDRIDEAVNEIQRIERLLAINDELSQTSNINNNAGVRAVEVNREVYNLISRSLRISTLTEGAFDITYDSIDKSLWSFNMDMTSLPDPVLAARTVKLINYRNLVLSHQHCAVYLRRKGMRIGFDGIGKGYAADKARELLMSRGVEHGIVNVSGNVVTWGQQPSGEPWTIAIADPDQAKLPFSKLELSNMAVVTHGNNENFITIAGKLYSHTIDPKTGLPVSGIKSVSIICASAELAYAMATPVMVLGVKPGLNLVNQMDKIACVIIDENDKVHCSQNMNTGSLL